MARLTYAQLEQAWIQGGGSQELAPLMAAIALAESGGDPQATNPTDNGGRQTSWGLWQISNGDHSEPSADWDTPVGNARLAVGKIRSQGLRAWGTYDTGAYRQYLQGNVPPDTSGNLGGAGGGASGTPGAGGQVSQADLVSTLGPWLGPLINQFTNNSSLALPSVVGNVFGPISNTLQDFDHALASGMHAVLWLVNPMNWVRIIAGVVGTAAAIAGTVLLYQAA